MKYTKPKFDDEWEEALRYREFEKMGKDKWIETAEKGFLTDFSSVKDVLNNVDLDFDTLDPDKKKRFQKHFKEGIIELPIAVKFSNNDYDLLGGNTRLAGLVLNKKNPKIWVVDMTKKDVNENDLLKGGSSDNMTLQTIAKKHDKKGYYHTDDMVKHLEKQLKMGIKDEMEHTDNPKIAREIAMDHLYKDPDYYTKEKKLDKGDQTEETGADSAGGFEPALGYMPIIKRKVGVIHNSNINEIDSGQYDVAAFAGPGRKDPLKIDGVKTIAKRASYMNKNKIPKWGGPGGVFIKIKDKCKKFPYCNQGDINSIEILKESIEEASKKYGIPKQEIEKIIIKEIEKIFI